jgi:hypothetical protein
MVSLMVQEETRPRKTEISIAAVKKSNPGDFSV